MHLLKNIFLISLLCSTTNAIAAEINTCKQLGDKLYDCTPFECDTTSPDDATKKIHNQIVGYNANKECVHIQSNPNGDKLTCKYSEESRRFLSLQMKKAASDLLHLPQNSSFEENIIADIFNNECDVNAAAGNENSGVEETDSPGSMDQNYDESDDAKDPEEQSTDKPSDNIDTDSELTETPDKN